MTRINCIPVDELADQHLLAEYRELPRVFALAEDALFRVATEADRIFSSMFVATATGEDLDRLAELVAAPNRPYRRIFDASGQDAPAEVYLEYLHTGEVQDGYRLETDAELRVRVRAGSIKMNGGDDAG